jgi:ferredoxin
MPTVSVINVDKDGKALENDVTRVEVEENQLLFDALDDKGVKLPHGCMAGSCGTCRVEVIEGAENLSDPSVVEADTITHIHQTYKETYDEDYLANMQVRLTCRAKIKGDVTIKVLKK